MRHHLFLALALVAGLGVAGCGRVRADVDPKAIEEAYGVTGAYVDQISTQNGTVDATIVPTTLDDGRRVQLVIPHKQLDPDYKVYMREGVTITPVALADSTIDRRQFVSRPVDIERRTAESEPVRSSNPVTRRKRSTKDEILIVGGGAGAGTAIGALTGGKKGAAVGALSGGIAGLVYDLATRKK